MWLETVLGLPLNLLIICLLACATRVAIQTEAMTIKSVLGILLSAIFLALIAYPLLVDAEYSTGLITLLVALGSFGARDIMLMLQTQFKKDPLGVLRNLLNWHHSSKKDSPEDEK